MGDFGSSNSLGFTKPLGRPKKGEPYEVAAGERNPIEGKFWTSKGRPMVGTESK